MKIRRKTINKINRISRLRPWSAATRKKVYKIFQKLITEFDSSCGGRSVEIDQSRKYIRKDENVDIMMFYFWEKFGGVIIFSINILENNAEICCRFSDGKIFSSHMATFEKTSIEKAERFLLSPELESKVVYRIVSYRPLDNLNDIIGILDDAVRGDKNTTLTHLCPNYDQTYFDPSVIFKAAGYPFMMVEPNIADGNHLISVPKQFPGYKKYISTIHSAYRKEYGRSTIDISKIFITLEVEKRIWAEQVSGIGKFLQRAREHIGQPLNVYINGMTATVNGNQIENFDKIRLAENSIVHELTEIAPPDTIVRRGFGKTIQEKIEDCKNYGFYIGPFGSSAVVPTVLGIPGINYQNKFFINRRSKRMMLNLKYVIKVDAKYINNLSGHHGVEPIFQREKGNESSMSLCSVGYSINADIFEKLAFDHYRAVQKHMTKISIYEKILKIIEKRLC